MCGFVIGTTMEKKREGVGHGDKEYLWRITREDRAYINSFGSQRGHKACFILLRPSTKKKVSFIQI